jgi:hypothetical protein
LAQKGSITMNASALIPKPLQIVRKFALILLPLLLMGAGPAYATYPTLASVASEPKSVSVSRDVAGGTPSADYYVSYKVTISNRYGAQNVKFIGDVTVTGVGFTLPTQFTASDANCTMSGDSASLRISCQPVLVPARQGNVSGTKVLTFQFRSPTAGDQIQFRGTLYRGANYGSATAPKNATTTLVKLTEPEYTLGFETFVPKTGGTFFTGVNGNLVGSPGGVATATDPWITTVVVPAINFTTTASASEGPSGVPCAGFYAPDACFKTDLTIPSAPGAFQSLIVYLRVDVTKHLAIPIGFAVIQYSKDGISFVPVRNCATPTPDPLPGDPCIEVRKFYDGTAPLVWQGDWEFKIRAVDNGRYRN